jgi:hypothetical protein
MALEKHLHFGGEVVLLDDGQLVFVGDVVKRAKAVFQRAAGRHLGMGQREAADCAQQAAGCLCRRGSQPWR